MSKSIAQAYSFKNKDECYTPKILVECIKPFFDRWICNTGIKKITKYFNETGEMRSIRVWLPFDTIDSEFYYFFTERYPDINVIVSHLSTGQDFFTWQPEVDFDIVISNPPFSRKLDVFKRLNSFGKPWAMVMNTMSLNYMEIGNYFADNPIQLLIPDKRVSFNGNPSSFNSCYVCKDFLPKDLMFVHLPHCNSGKDYVPSRMYKK